MIVQKLKSDNLKAFIEYCKKYSKEQDESYTAKDNYKISKDEPAYILLDDSNEITGAASVMLYPEFIKAKYGRFRIFHTVIKTKEAYQMLFDAVLKDIRGVEEIYCFIDEKKKEICNLWEAIGFSIKRYSWILSREVDGSVHAMFPEGYELKTLRDGIDEQVYCDICNEAFANIQGHYDLTPAKLNEWKTDKGYINGGIRLLWYGAKAVGFLRLTYDNIDGTDLAFIETLAVLNLYQNKGLGKNLLRASLELASELGYKKAMLSVNAENSKATDLYISEGFSIDTIYVCYSYKII